MTDQQRWDALSCSGTWVQTPNVDRVAATGVRFAAAYTNSPVCIPARVSLVTGLYPHDLKLWKNQPYTLDVDTPTWMRSVREAGYRTSLFGKTHLHRQRGDLREKAHLLHAYGFDDTDEIAGPKASVYSRSSLTELWRKEGVYEAFRRDLAERTEAATELVRPSPLPLELYPDVYIGRRAADYLRSYDRKQPWFCWVSFTGPHEPWDAPEPYASMYDPAAMPPPVEPLPTTWTRPTGLLDQRMERGIPFEEGDLARMRANYAGKVTLIDDQVGELLKTIEDRGEADRTVVVFISDHGEMNGDYGLIRKQAFLNGAVRIPFVISMPHELGASTGAVRTAPVELMDLGPTLVELAGGKLSGPNKARSLVSLLRDPAADPREDAISEVRHETMLATKDWKAAVNRAGEVYMLFDLRADPDERLNLAGSPEHAEVSDELQRRLIQRTARRRSRAERAGS
jgi:arylsulfatase